MSPRAATEITSSSPKQVDLFGRELRSSNAPLVSYEGQEGDLVLSFSVLFVGKGPWFREDSFTTVSEVGDHTDSASAAIESKFVQLVAPIREVERIFIRKDRDYMRIWTVIQDISVDVEDRIYDAQLAFLKKYVGIPCDFSVIFRQDLDPATLNPMNAQVLFSR